MDEMSHLIIIPIVHTHADSGSLGDKISSGKQYEARALQFWAEVSRYLDTLPLDLFPGLRVYQDSLINGPEEIVDKVVEETQTPNFEILRWLKGKGATIIGTESGSLLTEEIQGLRAIVDCQDEVSRKAARLAYFKKSLLLLDERDEYIAGRIAETLPRGGTGLLFIGSEHDVESYLGKEIQVSTPEMITRVLTETLQNPYSVIRERE
ncbi:MAG: hypothetical protein HYV38_03470 [Candidatus Levybacteria bacterium]|nr:hypothetical protein [Candidatus Levybacteria bacterium]